MMFIDNRLANMGQHHIFFYNFNVHTTASCCTCIVCSYRAVPSAHSHFSVRHPGQTCIENRNLQIQFVIGNIFSLPRLFLCFNIPYLQSCSFGYSSKRICLKIGLMDMVSFKLMWFLIF